MPDNKKYYYLKLKDDFFESEEIKMLESMDNGYKYSNILLKLYLRSLKRDGLLMFKDKIPYNAKMIATVTGHNVNDVKQALHLFEQFDLIERLPNGVIYMMDIQNFIGKSSTEADRIRSYRNEIEKKKKELLNGAEDIDFSVNLDGETGNLIEGCTDVVTNVQQMNDKCTPEKEREKEKEIDKDQQQVPYQKIADLYNDIAEKLPNIRKVNDQRKRHLKARWNEEGNIDVFEEVFEIAENTPFLTGDNERNWTADFDWIIKNNSNFNKILEGKYGNCTTEEECLNTVDYGDVEEYINEQGGY